ncbi:MAG: transporter substrate-binding domain-containing protein [Clostridia bacterium]|nr:transporter substrate-binding domain-containing protein [Clostridia bacterium]
MIKKVLSISLAFCIVLCIAACRATNNETILSDTLSTDTQVPNADGKWDVMLLNCDNEYFIVKRTIETYNSLTYEVGVVDKNNNWIREPSSTNSLAECIAYETGKTTITGQKTSVGSRNFYYLGSGVVVASLGVEINLEDGTDIKVGDCDSISSLGLDCYFYNIKEDKSFAYNANSISTVIDGYIIMKSDEWIRITDTGEDEIPFVAKLAPYSEGLFLGAPDTNFHGHEYGFFDINGTLRIDMSQYDLQDIEKTKFTDGYCNIAFKNPAGNTYYATIDKMGNFVREPSKDMSILEESLAKKDSTSEACLVVAVNAAFEPYLYMENGEIVGFEADLIEAIALEIGRTVVYRNMDFDNIIDDIAKGNSDVGISFITPTTERKEKVDFSKPYLLDASMNDTCEIAIAVNKNKNLLSVINPALNKLLSDGTVEKLIQKYDI